MAALLKYIEFWGKKRSEIRKHVARVSSGGISKRSGNTFDVRKNLKLVSSLPVYIPREGYYVLCRRTWNGIEENGKAALSDKCQ